ncbi:MAG: hypothetical protein H7256_03180 [Bdellovibrio sp.]|nr:hypothetical protein [Bdellovibrio sp.]
MSRLDELKDQLKATGQRIGTAIQETEGYQKLQDHYQSLNPSSQKMAWVGGIVLAAGLVLFYPLSQISNSQALMVSFEEKRNLIRDLFKTYRESSAQASIPVPPAVEILKSSIDTIINGANLLPEQRVGTIESTVEGRLIPQSLVSHVLEVKLAKLNLKQIVDIGTSITGISPSVKMKDLVITAHSTDTRYFDVTYKLYSLNVPEPTPEPLPEPEIKTKKGNAKPSNKDDKEAGE